MAYETIISGTAPAITVATMVEGVVVQTATSAGISFPAAVAGAGIYPSGVRQIVVASLTARTTTTAAFALGTSPPTNTQGAEALTVTIVPQSATSFLHVTVNALAGITTPAVSTGHAIYRDAGAAIGATVNWQLTNAGTSVVSFTAVVASGSTASTIFRYRFGVETASTAVLNGANIQYFGSAASTRITVIEYGA